MFGKKGNKNIEDYLGTDDDDDDDFNELIGVCIYFYFVFDTLQINKIYKHPCML